MNPNRTLWLTACALIAIGCGSTKNEPSSANTPTDKSGQKISVVFIPKSAGNPYFAQMEEGFKRSADKFGIEFSSQAPQSANATSQVEVIQNQVQRGQQVIVISPNSPDALNAAIEEATKKGVIVLTADADLTGNEDKRAVGILPVDFTTVGPEQIELLGSMINYEGEIAILSATSDAPNQNAWIETMKTALKDAKYSKMKLVEIAYGDDEPQKSSTEMEGLLTKHPNLKGVISPTTVGLSAAAQVLSQREVFPGGKNAKNGGIILTGLGTPNEMRKSVEKGVVQKFQLWDPADMGDVAAFLAFAIKNNKYQPSPDTFFEIPGKGRFDTKAKNVITAGKLVTFDSKNISQFKF
jgi:rhamnose transport system substrate-binding protein